MLPDTSRGPEGTVYASLCNLVPEQLAESVLWIGLAHSEGMSVVFGHIENHLIRFSIHSRLHLTVQAYVMSTSER